MGFTLTPRKKRTGTEQIIDAAAGAAVNIFKPNDDQQDDQQPAPQTPAASQPVVVAEPPPVSTGSDKPALNLTPSRRVNLENEDPENVVSQPQSPLYATGDTSATRPRLVFSQPAAAAPAAAAPAPPDQDELDTAELAARNQPNDQNPYLKKHNSKLKSGLLGALSAGGDAARAALARGDRNPLAATLGGAVGGGVAGGVHDRWDEEQANETRRGQLEHNIGFSLARRGQEQDIETKQNAPAIALSRINSEERIAAAKLKNEQAVEAGRMTRAAADLANKELDRKAANQRNADTNASRERVAGIASNNSADKNKIPESFYRGRNTEELKDTALRNVLGSGSYDQHQIRPEVLEAYGGDVNKLQQAIRAGTVSIGNVFSDPQKGAAFQSELANEHARLSSEARDHDAAIDMTSKSRNVPKITLADFDAAFQKFHQDYTAAPNMEARLKLKRQFQQALSQRRLVGE